MPDPRTDLIAREAARLIQTGKVSAIEAAIRIAADSRHLCSAPLPSTSRVRKHARMMAMQHLGSSGYAEAQNKVWRVAEEIMTALEHVFPDGKSLLVGRAAQGHVDASLVVHIRLYTTNTISHIAQALVEFGYDEPAFHTVDTLHGRMNQFRLVEEGIEVVVTRCLPEFQLSTKTDLLTGVPIEAMDLVALQRRIADEAKPA